MNTSNTENTSNTTSKAPSMPFIVGESRYYTLFGRGGAYYDYFIQMLEQAEKENNIHYNFLNFATMGFICGLMEARNIERIYREYTGSTRKPDSMEDGIKGVREYIAMIEKIKEGATI